MKLLRGSPALWLVALLALAALSHASGGVVGTGHDSPLTTHHSRLTTHHSRLTAPLRRPGPRAPDIVIEAESLTPAGAVWYPTSDRDLHLSLPVSEAHMLGASLDEAGSAAATLSIRAPGRYRVYTRYLEHSTFAAPFTVSLSQGGRKAGSGTFGSERRASGPWRRFLWGDFECDLAAGEARLSVEKSPGSFPVLDAFYLTASPRAEPPSMVELARRTFARLLVSGVQGPFWLAVDWQIVGGSFRTPYASLGRRQFEAGATPDSGEWIGPETPSGWCDLTTALDHSATGFPRKFYQHTVTFTVRGGSLKVPSRAIVEWSRSPDESGILATTTYEIDSPEAAFVLDRDVLGVRSVASISQEQLAAVEALKLGARPTRYGPFIFGTELEPFPSPALASLGARTLALLGVNQLNSGYHSVPVRIAQAAKAAGIPTLQCLDFVPVAPSGSWGEVEPLLASWAAAMRRDNGSLPAELRAMVGSLKITDENWTVFPPPRAFSNEAARREFWDWLRQKGMTPAAFGKSRWEEVILAVPEDFWNFAGEARLRLTDAGERLIWYWMLKFIHHRTARYYQRATQLAREFWGPQLLTKNTWDPGPPSSYGLAHWLDFFEYGRQAGTPILLIDDWTGETRTRTHNPYFAALLRAAARPKGLRVGFDTISDVSNGTFMRRKIYTNAAHGATYQDFYTFGPKYRSIEWAAFSDSPSICQAVGQCTRELASLSPWLEGARMRPSGVAILYSVSNDAWWMSQSFFERFGLFQMLVDADTVPDFVSEADVVEGVLVKYRTLVLPSPCLTRTAAAAVAAWVQRGGRLVGVTPAGLFDESKSAIATLKPVWGVDRVTAIKEGLLTLDAPEVAALPGGTKLYGALYRNTGGTARVTRRTAGGDPLLLENAHGRGRAYLFTANLGVSYQKAGNSPEELRNLFLDATGGTVPVVPGDERVLCEEPEVLATSFAGPGGVTVFLVNFDKAYPDARVEIRGVANITSVRSLARGRLPFKPLPDRPGVLVQLPLDVTDALVVTQRPPRS